MYGYKPPTIKEMQNTLADLILKRAGLNIRVDTDRVKCLNVRIKAIKSLITMEKDLL